MEQPKLTKDQIKKRLKALEYYESSQWAILRSGEDDPDLLYREIDRCTATRTKLLRMLQDVPSH